MAFKIDINIMLCPIKVNSNTIELRVHTSCYCVLDLFNATGIRFISEVLF